MINISFNLFLILTAVIQSFMLLIFYWQISSINILNKLTLALPMIMYVSFKWVGFFFFIPVIFFFFYYGFYTTRITNKLLLWFYSVYTLFAFSIFSYGTQSVIEKIFGSKFVSEHLVIINFLFIPVVPIILHSILVYFLKPTFEYLKNHGESLDKTFFLSINALMTILCIFQFFNYFFEDYLIKKTNPIRFYIIIIFIVILISLLTYLNSKMKELKNKQIRELKDEQLNNLKTYIKQIESMYNELRYFRHDYKNTLISLNESIKSNNLDSIKETYSKIISNEGVVLDDSHYSFSKLDNLKTLPIKGIFSSNLISAWHQNIQINLEIEDPICNEPIDLYDYIKIISILLTNALEAASESEDKFINISYIFDRSNNLFILIIDNSFDYINQKLNLLNIYESGVSTKGKNKGMGLYKLNEVLEKYDNISIETKIEKNHFIQKLIIKEDN